MLHLIPAPLHRALLRVAHGLRRAWWGLRKPRVHGCRVLALDEQGRVLLVRQSYGSGMWMPPGGGIGPGEAADVAARRELFEETGCRLVGSREVAVVVEELHGAENIVHVVAGLAHDEARADMREIIEARFFAADRLPGPMAGRLDSDIPVWIAAYHGQSKGS